MATIDVQARELPRNYWIAGFIGASACVISASPHPLSAAAWIAPAAAIPLLLWMLQSASRWLWCFFFAALLLPPLPFALGNSGPHIGVAIAGVGLVCGALRVWEWRLERDLLTFSLAVFFLVLLFSSALAVFYSGLDVAAGSLLRVLLFGIPVYIFVYSAHGPAPAMHQDAFGGARRLYWFGLLSAAFACVDFYYQFPAPAGYGPQFIWLASGVYRRAQGFFYEASTLGNVCAFFLIMIAVTLFRDGSRRLVSRWALWLGAPVLFARIAAEFVRRACGASLPGARAHSYNPAVYRRRQLSGRRCVGRLADFPGSCVELLAAPFTLAIFLLATGQRAFGPRGVLADDRSFSGRPSLARHSWHRLQDAALFPCHRPRHRRRQHVS